MDNLTPPKFSKILRIKRHNSLVMSHKIDPIKVGKIVISLLRCIEQKALLRSAANNNKEETIRNLLEVQDELFSLLDDDKTTTFALNIFDELVRKTVLKKKTTCHI